MERDVRRKIETYCDSLLRYLAILEASGNYYSRRQIRMSDLELREYLMIMRAEVLLLPVDAIACETFLEYEECRKKGLLEILGIRRVPMLDRYRRYLMGVKASMELRPGMHVKIKEKSDECYYSEGAAAAEAARHAKGDEARQDRAVPGAQVGERRAGGGDAPGHGVSG